MKDNGSGPIGQSVVEMRVISFLGTHFPLNLIFNKVLELYAVLVILDQNLIFE